MASNMFAWGMTLVQHLQYPAILSKIDQINKANEIGLTEVAKEECTKQIKLPQTIVIGDKGSRKSSTLERIAMVNVLPQSANICTQQPIVLKLCMDERYKHDEPMLKLTIPSFNRRGTAMTIESRCCHDVREAIHQRMNAIVKHEHDGFVIAEEISVEVQSDGVPTLDLVDLPGLIQVKANQSANLAKVTEQCTQEYLQKESTGAVVCVLDAGMDNLRSSNTIRLLQQAPDSLRQHAIGVYLCT